MVTKRCVNRILGLAEKAERDGDPTEALRLSDAILRDFPIHPDARRLRARIWARTGMTEPALAEFRDLAQRNADDIEARMGLASLLMLKREYGDAVDHLTAVAKICHDEYRRGDQAATSPPTPFEYDYSMGLNELEENIGSGVQARRSVRRRIG